MKNDGAGDRRRSAPLRATAEWGLAGANALAAEAAVVVVVDVLSFSTCVDVATARGATVAPFHSSDRAAAAAEARRLGTELAGRRRDGARYSLSPTTLQKIPAGARLLLPSPNGSRVAASARGRPLLAGCLRNARAVAAAATKLAKDGMIAVIPAGERWPGGGFRPAIEDLLGTGAVLSALDADMSPEAEVARVAFLAVGPRLAATIRGSVSGRELISLGFAQDVEIAVDCDASTAAPLLTDGAFAAM